MTEKNKTLWDHAQTSRALDELILSEGGELSPILETWLDEVSKDMAPKVDGYKAMMDLCDYKSEYFKVQGSKFTDAGKSYDRFKERLKDRIKQVMEVMGTDEVKGEYHRFKLQLGPSRLVLNESKLPNALFTVRQVKEPDKERINQLLDEKVDVTGATRERSWFLKSYINKDK